MATGDEEAQEDELLALASIYNEDVFEVTREDGKPGGQFSARLQLPDHFSVQSDTSDTLSKNSATLHEVKYLLPIMLFFQLPPDYPSCSSPTFTISCKWLTLQQLSQLCHRLDAVWEENKGDVILFLWMSFLKDEALSFLQITSPLDLSHVVASMKLKRAILQWQVTASKSDDLTTKTVDGSEITAGHSDSQIKHKSSLTSSEQLTFDPRAIQDIGSQQMLLPAILEYDREQRLCVFRQTVYTCQVCFVEKLGDDCLQFDRCGHVYCKDCMRAYFNVQIQDGSVQCLTCPYELCESQAHPAQVKELVTSEMFARYDRLLLQASLESMPDVLYCSRKTCGCAVMVDTESSMARCPSCHYVFCVYCKQVYHGISPCRIKEEEARKLREQYTNASPQERKMLERRYGLPAIHHVMEETETLEWLEEHSKKCPHCGTHIQKIDGCNKMTCTKCRCYFCWMCGETLSHRSPYAHFSNPTSPCFNKLFHGVILNDDDDDDDEWLPID